MPQFLHLFESYFLPLLLPIRVDAYCTVAVMGDLGSRIKGRVLCFAVIFFEDFSSLPDPEGKFWTRFIQVEGNPDDCL